MWRRLLLLLVLAQFVLLVALAVLVGGYALANATSDAMGATVLWWLIMACLMLIVTDVLLLVGVLGLSAILASERPPEAETPSDRHP
jgi:uncharacterized membrane protein